MHNTYQIVQALGKTPDTDHKYHCGYFHSEMLGRLSSLQKYPSDPAKLKHCKGEGMLCNHLCEGVVLESRLNSGPLTFRQDPWFPGNSVILYKPNVFILWNSNQWNAENSVVRLLSEFGLRFPPRASPTYGPVNYSCARNQSRSTRAGGFTPFRWPFYCDLLRTLVTPCWTCLPHTLSISQACMPSQRNPSHISNLKETIFKI